MAYNLGINIGISSVGFAGVNIDDRKILFTGAHIFVAAENPKTGASLALKRREKRALRRVLRRRAVRKKRIRQLLIEQGFENVVDIDHTPNHITSGSETPLPTPWDYRREALLRPLNDGEFCRVLFHIAKRRGFQSSRKEMAPDRLESKKALSGAVALQEAMLQSGARTVGAYLAGLPKKRNSSGSYERFVTRDLLRSEIKCIFEAQRKFGNTKAGVAFQATYENIAFSQKPMPSSEPLVGYCSLEPAEKRAPRFSYSAELFVLWSKLNSLRIKYLSGEERPLTQDEKDRLAEKAHARKSLNYKQARRELGLSEQERFNIFYRKTKDEDDGWKKIRDMTENADFLKLVGYHALKEALGGDAGDWIRWTGKDRDALDEVARVLSFYEDEKEVDEKLAPIVADKGERQALAGLTTFSKTLDVSLKAIRKILPYMQQGFTYSKACAAAGYSVSRRKNPGLRKLPPFEDVPDPVVNRALARARKVINAVILKYGMPGTFIVQLARELGRPFSDRKDIERQQKKNEAYKVDLRKQVEEEILGGRAATAEGLFKYRLWKEQESSCCYCDAEITPLTLRDPLGTQVSHIIPFSRSWDDSYMNKIVCHAACNQKKGNRTPYEWLGQTNRWDRLQAMARKLPPRKAERLLMQIFDDKKASDWKDGNLNDTRYAARLIKSHIEQNLALGRGTRVQTRNGALTTHLRSAWGFPDKNHINDRRHALAAIVLACSTQSMVQRLADWNKYDAQKIHPDQKPMPPKPWETFRKDALTAVYGAENPLTGKREGGILVSRMPCRKVTGAAHEETIRSIRHTAEGKRQIVQRVKLKDLSPANLERLVDKQRNSRLYKALKDRLDAFGGKPGDAFVEPIYMPVNDPAKQGPAIRAVRILTNDKTGVEVQGGLASNGDMVRVDVFLKGNKYLLVPVYVHHFAGKALPNKAILASKDEKDWEPVDDEDFIFSLYKNDFVKIVSKKETLTGYYISTNRDSATISMRPHDSDPSFGINGIREGVGVKTVLCFEKYTVDYLGKLNRVYKEPRLGLRCTAPSEPGEADD